VAGCTHSSARPSLHPGTCHQCLPDLGIGSARHLIDWRPRTVTLTLAGNEPAHIEYPAYEDGGRAPVALQRGAACPVPTEVAPSGDVGIGGLMLHYGTPFNAPTSPGLLALLGLRLFRRENGTQPWREHGVDEG
jgi:hypothetical protein